MKTVVLCAKKMNYDGLMDLSLLSEDVDIYDDADEEKLFDRIRDADTLVTKENPVTRQMIEGFPDRLKLIVEAGTGYNNIDIRAAKDRGITVCNIPAYSTDSVAELAVMFVLMLSHSMGKQIALLNKGNHSQFEDHLSVSHHEASSLTLGVIGEGRIGRKVIETAGTLGMDVLVYTRTPKEDREGVRHVSLETLLQESDFVSLHCPLTEDTRHLIDKKALSLMKKSAYLVNTSRGALVDEEALIEALRNRTIAGAALDVQEREPLSADSPLFTLDNVLLTPHIGWKTEEARERLLQILKENIDAYREGHPVNVVN